MERIKKYALTAFVIGGLVLFYRWYFRPLPTVNKPEYTLKADEKTKTLIDTRKRTVTVVTDKGVVQKRGVRKVEIITKKDGSTKVKAREFGLCLEPGLAVGVVDSPRLALDAQWLYWREVGSFVGVSYSPSAKSVRGYVALGYTLPFDLFSNTSAYVTYDTKQEVGFMIRVRF